MKQTIKKEVIKEMRMPHLHFINKQGKPIVRKKELQQMVCKAQLKIKKRLSKAVTQYIDSNGHHKFEMSTGWYNVAFGKWVDEGLLTRNRKDGYKITELGRLFASTDTRAYEIEMWKRKFEFQKQRADRLNSDINDLRLEKKKWHDRVDEIYFGKEFMDSDDKGTLKDYDDTRDIAIRCVDKLVESKILDDKHHFEVQDTIQDEINKEFDIPNFDVESYIYAVNNGMTEFDIPKLKVMRVESSPKDSIINTCLSNMQESLNCISKHINKE